MNRRLQYLAGIIKEDINPYEDEFDSYTLKQGLVSTVKAMLAKHGIPEDSRFNFENVTRNPVMIKENATVEEAVDIFLEKVNAKFTNIETWIERINEQSEQDWLDDQRSGLPDDEWADYEPDYEMDEDELIHNTEELVEDCTDDNITRDRKWTTWGIMFYGLVRGIGSFAWRAEQPK